MDPVNKPEKSQGVPPLLGIGLIIICWCMGFLLSLNPSSTASLRERSSISLSGATSHQIGDQLFFEMPIAPAHQQRWAQSLQLKPIPQKAPVFIPDFSILSNWHQRKGVQRAPYSEEEVQAWWDHNGSVVSKGYVRRFPTGGYIVLDLQRDRLAGWLNLTSWESLLH